LILIATLAQAQISTEVVDRMLDAKLSQLMGVGFVLIVLLLFFFAYMFNRTLNRMDKQIDTNTRLVNKLDSLDKVGKAIDEQNDLLRGIDVGIKQSNVAAHDAATALAQSDNQTKRNLETVLENVAALATDVAEGRKEAIQEVKNHMDENAKTTDERLTTLETDVKELKKMVGELLDILRPKTPDPADPPPLPADKPTPE